MSVSTSVFTESEVNNNVTEVTASTYYNDIDR